MANQPDELDGVRAVRDALRPFSHASRVRIVRSAFELLGEAAPDSVARAAGVPVAAARPQTPPLAHQAPSAAVAPADPPATAVDIKSFVATKNPNSDMQFAAVVAYYYALEAPIPERKEEIAAQDLLDACRKAKYARPTNPGQTLRNAQHNGYLDKGDARGAYKINAVGENMVAMVLGADATAVPVRRKSPRKKRKSSRQGAGAKKAGRKKAPKES